jgi:hypothetical protein
MRLSNKSTFSLASLFVLLAIGCIFIATPAMAHIEDSGVTDFEALHDGVDNDTGQHNDPSETNHTHTGLVTAEIELVDIKIGEASTIKETADGKFVTLVADPIAAAARDATAQFQVKVTFNQNVYEGVAGTNPAELALTDFTIVAALRSASATNIGATAITGATTTAATDDAATEDVDESLRVFTVTFTVVTGTVNNILGDSTADPVVAPDPLDIRIKLNASAVQSATGLVNLQNIEGRNSEETSDFRFTLVNELPADPAPVVPDTPPTLTITHSPADMAELPASGNVTFTFTFNEALGTNDAAFTLGDVMIEGGSAVDFGGSGMVYTLEVMPDDPMTSVTVTVAASAVADTTGNNLAADAMETYTADDTVAPTVTITSAPGTGDDAGKIVFTFTFSEALMAGSFTADDLTRGTGVTLAGNPMMDATDAKVYTVLVNPAATGDTILTLKTGSVMDMQGNPLVGDQAHTYEPPPEATPATITTTDLGNTTAGATLTITFSKDPGTVTAMVGTDSVAVTGTGTTRMITAGTATGTTSVALTWTGTDSGTSDDGSGTVTYTIPAPEANTSPDIMIAANSYVVVVRDTAGATGTLLTTYDSGITLAAWGMMPDLSNVFDTGAIHGGGALILRQSGDTAAHPGTVGISEIMWAIDEDKLENAVARRAGQWIELHNLNTTAVTVKLSWKTGAKAIAGDTSINGNLAAPYLDVVTNVFHERPGNAHWVLPGSNGNSGPSTPANFVSAARKGTFSLTSKHDGKFNKRYTKTDKGENASNSPDGRNKDQWAASTVPYARRTVSLGVGLGNVAYEDHGTPGRVNSFNPERADVRAGRTDVKFNTVTFNEIANRSNEAYEWIELYNGSDGEINLRNYLISIVEAKPAQADRDKPDNDKIFYQFPSNDNAKIASKGVFLLVASDPRGNPDHPLAVGYNVDIDDEDQVVGSRKNPIHYKVMRKDDQAAYQYEGTGLPDTGKFVLILRRPDNGEGHRSGADGGKGVAERGKDDLDKVIDVAGWHDDLHITNYPNVVSSTNLWPLRNFEKLDFNRNKFELDRVHYRSNRSSRGSHNDHRAAWQDAGYSGIGYKLQASDSAAHGGTPGYHGNVRGKAADLADGKVVISEIMLSQGSRGNLPQWIELYNPSKTHAVNLADNAGWRLVIENPDRAPIITINFKNKGNVKYIQPNSTVLIVSSSARDYGHDDLSRGTVFPDTRVLNAYTAIRGETFEIGRGDPLLDPKAFNVRLLDGKTHDNKPNGRYIGEVSDEVGNLDGNPRTNDEAAWEFPAGMTADGDRTSLIRIFDEGEARDGKGMVEPLNGTGDGGDGMAGIDAKYSWIHAVDTEDLSRIFVRHTWYGARTDFGTPADRTGQVLPVNLSFFRPTLQDGKVTIRWTTESELDNAGFNILRSDERNGEYKQVNAELIKGAGTTGERTNYSWVDQTAKPGVVYYYQIEDVSFAGERQALALTKLKGLISAKNKLTTRWGELKSQD